MKPSSPLFENLYGTRRSLFFHISGFTLLWERNAVGPLFFHIAGFAIVIFGLSCKVSLFGISSKRKIV